jgi:hypothetical protein
VPNPGSPGGRYRMPGAQPAAGHNMRRMRTEAPAVARREAPSVRRAAGKRRAGFGGALRSELTKIRTVRSTYWTLAAMTAVTVFTGTVICLFTGPGAVGPGYDPDLPQPARLHFRPARHRGVGGGGHHLGILHRDDRRIADRAATAGHPLRGQSCSGRARRDGRSAPSSGPPPAPSPRRLPCCS